MGSYAVAIRYDLPNEDTSKDYTKIYRGDFPLSIITVITHPYGWALTGWSYTKGGEKIKDSVIQPKSSIELHALWDSASKKMITYYMETEPEIEKVISVTGSTNLPKPEETGFKGWSLTPGGEVIGSPTFTPTDDTELYAVWEEAQTGTPVIVDFLGNGGGGNMPAIAAPQKYTAPDSEFTAPTGYHFTGWKIEGIEDVIFVPGDEIEFGPGGGTYTLVAQWEMNNACNVTYWRNETATDTECHRYVYPGNTMTFLPENQFPEVAKTFKGWSVDRNDPVAALEGQYFLQEDIDWYAIWED